MKSLIDQARRNSMVFIHKIKEQDIRQTELVNFMISDSGIKTIHPNIFEELKMDVMFEFKSSLCNIMLASELLEASVMSHEQEMLVAIILRGTNRLKATMKNISNNILTHPD